MGFKVRPKVYRLRFEDEEMEGAVVECRSLPTGSFLRIAGLADQLQERSSADAAGEVLELFDVFADALISWNLEREDGTEIPCDSKGLGELDFSMTLVMIYAWMDAVVSVSAPLVKPSGSGATSPGVSLPMEPLSPSPGS